MVGHIMRLAAYLCTSRHGIFYFGFPVPADSNRGGSRSHIKLSLGTRDLKRNPQNLASSWSRWTIPDLANERSMNQCAFKHSALSLLLNASMKPLSVGFPGRETSSVTSFA